MIGEFRVAVHIGHGVTDIGVNRILLPLRIDVVDRVFGYIKQRVDAGAAAIRSHVPRSGLQLISGGSRESEISRGFYADACSGPSNIVGRINGITISLGIIRAAGIVGVIHDGVTHAVLSGAAGLASASAAAASAAAVAIVADPIGYARVAVVVAEHNIGANVRRTRGSPPVSGHFLNSAVAHVGELGKLGNAVVLGLDAEGSLVYSVCSDISVNSVRADVVNINSNGNFVRRKCRYSQN